LPRTRAARALRLPRPAQIQRELARVTTALRTYQHASRGAQDAIEIAIRGMGRASVNSILLLLPPKVTIPVGLAVRAVARVLDRSLDVGLGRQAQILALAHQAAHCRTHARKRLERSR
jgi:hypothetical protein